MFYPLSRYDIKGKRYLEALEGDTHHGGCGNCGD